MVLRLPRVEDGQGLRKAEATVRQELLDLDLDLDLDLGLDLG